MGLIQKLNRGTVESVVSELRSFPTRQAELRDELRIQADYFERNRNRRRYPQFRKQGLFIGSGVIEAGCGTVTGSPPQAVRYVLDRARRCHHCPTLQPAVRQIRGLLGLSLSRRLNHPHLCRTPVGTRLKRSGMHWTTAGANAIIALRCCRLSGRFQDFWEHRASGAASDPHCLPLFSRPPGGDSGLALLLAGAQRVCGAVRVSSACRRR